MKKINYRPAISNEKEREAQFDKAVRLQIKYTPMVKQALEPALGALGLDYFWYVRLLEGHFHISIGIQPPLVELYRQRNTADLYFFNPQILAEKETTVIWDLHESAALTNDMKNKIELAHGMCIFRRSKNHVDVWYIASKNRSSSLYDIYINNSAAIYRLIGYFNEAVLPRLPMDDPNFLLPYMDGCDLRLPKACSSRTNALDFYKATALKKFTLHSDQGSYNLTLREIQCLHGIAKGDTSKDIANALGLSYRTVEHYLENIRLKTGCNNRSELIQLYRKNDLVRWFDDNI